MKEQVLVKYCFSKLEGQIPNDKATYYTDIILELEREGVLQDIREFSNESPFFDEENRIIYQIEPGDIYAYTFSCNETREGKVHTFNFTIKFHYETHDLTSILYVEICSNDYIFSVDSVSNCLEILKHKLRRKIKVWKNRYCLLDRQSAYYAANLYPRIHEVENFFRHYVNDVFVKVFGADWWNEAIAVNIKENRKNRIKDTREYAGANKDIQPYLMSLELGDLMEIAHTKQFQWTPLYNSKIENVLNHHSSADLFALLKEQCQVKIDIWELCFKKHLSEDFATDYALFEKRRNQVAHNKLIDSDSYNHMFDLCNRVYNELVSAHRKFCLDFISQEEQELIEEYKAFLEIQKEEEMDSLKAIAEEESGIKVYTSDQIEDLLNDTLFSLYNELGNIFNERQDIAFSMYRKIAHIGKNQICFHLKHLVNDHIININATVDINDSQGEASLLQVSSQTEDELKRWIISFTNGEYSYDEEQTSYMPITIDKLDEISVEEARQGICDFIEEKFPNLREEADLYNHLEAMGKTGAITERDVYCWDCEEEYVCINEEFAPIGTCLNCGAKNHIIYCTYCQSPIEVIEAIEIDDKDEEPHYCSSCENKLFGVN